ncbi:glycosyltransferase family 39 protein [Coraliomargarita akajimensis]|uniref:Uncharacterized protein n=1 Tax=Coraliomargarita akajimensis (strain DSM 45221 / IAM 15411 / JCM 23193 / KCTC 12865 / 04OKA010-24) TaxID=583355 RepID=D5EMT2_CORAD|nr:glycosyltransferase family 39 protein [Coraliomargarita akajimensis]ADE55322.1 hypothetical protein Caka_2305 [Coraliomargarita akajimensis DSM 45221]
MPSCSELFTGLLLILIYGCSCAAIYNLLRARGQTITAAIALAIPLCQAVYSVIFQARFLSGSVLLGLLFSAATVVYSLHLIRTHHEQLKTDLLRAFGVARSYRWISIPFGFYLVYTFAQVLLLPPLNHDSLVYHLPRVCLYIQNNSLFLDSFTNYHQVIFPVGGDILFYPFIKLGTDAGLGIFSLTSYLSIGAACYAIARRQTSARIASTATLIVLSFTVLVLQAPSTKNDILAAAAGAGALLLTLESSSKTRFRNLILIGILCLFGTSIKTTFLAYIPGLALLLIYRTQLWSPTQISRRLLEAYNDRKLIVALTLPLLIMSQLWLYAWNIHNYTTWAGPEEFTHRNQQHDGIIGTIANLSRYAFQTAEIGILTDQFIAPAAGLSPPSESLQSVYESVASPLFGKAGATREEFAIQWIPHEDYAWFGPLGFALLLVGIPYSFRHPKLLIQITPALLYLLIVCAKVSWMPWNGRFMTLFFVSLIPILIGILQRVRSARLLNSLILLALGSMLYTRSLDANRYLFPIAPAINATKSLNNTPIAAQKLIRERFHTMWQPEPIEDITSYISTSELLSSIPEGARVAIFVGRHSRNYSLYRARPDIYWQPLNVIRSIGKISYPHALFLIERAEIDYLVTVDLKSSPEALPIRKQSTSGNFFLNMKASAP